MFMPARYFQGMAEVAGRAIDAVAARRDSMTQRQAVLTDADHRLAEAVAGAHALTVRALERLQRIEADIETAASAPEALALDTAAGAHAFQRLLLDKQHEIIAVVTEAVDEAASKTAVLQELLNSYRA